MAKAESQDLRGLILFNNQTARIKGSEITFVTGRMDSTNVQSVYLIMNNSKDMASVTSITMSTRLDFIETELDKLQKEESEGKKPSIIILVPEKEKSSNRTCYLKDKLTELKLEYQIKTLNPDIAVAAEFKDGKCTFSKIDIISPQNASSLEEERQRPKIKFDFGINQNKIRQVESDLLFYLRPGATRIPEVIFDNGKMVAKNLKEKLLSGAEQKRVAELIKLRDSNPNEFKKKCKQVIDSLDSVHSLDQDPKLLNSCYDDFVGLIKQLESLQIDPDMKLDSAAAKPAEPRKRG